MIGYTKKIQSAVLGRSGAMQVSEVWELLSYTDCQVFIIE